MKNNKFDYKKKNSKPNFGFDTKEFSREIKEASRTDVGAISVKNKGDSFSVYGIIDRVVQTGGPTIFSISDGTGILALKAF